MKVVSWNVNGARAVHKKGEWSNFLEKYGHFDVIGLQEIKAEESQLPPDMQNLRGFQAFFNSSKTKKGYSGVALYTRTLPDKVEYDIGINDQEGRVIAAYFGKIVVCNVYFPNGGGAPGRMEYKLDFYDAFLEYIAKLKKKGYSIVFIGDVNAAHEPIDLTHPDSNEGTPGYNPDVREWIDEVERQGFIDSFRHTFPRQVKYSYWDMKTRARDRNVGWRIDYVFISPDLLPKLGLVFIDNDIYGSDHCPIGAELSL